jgi:integral membrane protein
MLLAMKMFFRVVSFLEGTSYLLLLFVAVPIKYWMDDPQYVKLLGMPHGLLFVTYLVITFLIKSELKWSKKTLGVVMLASVIPFGTFYVDKKYLRN